MQAPRDPSVVERDLVLLSSCGRDGGTLLARLLDGSPDLWVHPVDVVYVTIWDDLARRGAISPETTFHATTRRLSGLDRPAPPAAILDELTYHWHEIDEFYRPLLEEPMDRSVDPRDVLASYGELDVRRLLPAFLEATRVAYDNRSEPRRAMVFKSVETPYVAEYLRLLPDTRCIHLVRNPVSNWSSVKRSWSYHQQRGAYYGRIDILRAFLEARWLPHARAAVELLAADPARHRLVRYEDLRAAPAQVVADLCSWLGARPSEDAARLTSLGGRAMKAMPADPRPSKPGIEPPGRVVPDMAGTYGYEEVVTERERALIEVLTGPLCRELGYPPGGDASVASRLGLLARWLPPDRSELLHFRSPLVWSWGFARRRAYLASQLLRPVRG